jgi:hypothetical protein
MMSEVRSSRRLEAACYNRIDVIWLMQGQTPDHATIAAFIKKHGKEVHQLFRDTLRALVSVGLVPLEHVAVDGTKVEANAGKGSVKSETTLEEELRRLEAQIEALEREWSKNERREKHLFGEHTPWIPAKGSAGGKQQHLLEEQRQKLEHALEEIERRRQESAGNKEIKALASTTDPEARVMKDKEGRVKPNYNCQAVVDEAHGVVVACEVNDAADDSGQLSPMIQQVIENGLEKPQAASADGNYNTGPDLRALTEMQVVAYLPESTPKVEATHTLQAILLGEEVSEAQREALPRNSQKLLDKKLFVYDAGHDAYECPSGKWLPRLRSSADQKKWGTAVRVQYGGITACGQCPLASLCCKNPSQGRTLNRDQYEFDREALRQRMITPEALAIYRKRMHIVEPFFGYVKRVLGIRKFLRRGREAVRTEWTLVCLAVNFRILLKHWTLILPWLQKASGQTLMKAA